MRRQILYLGLNPDSYKKEREKEGEITHCPLIQIIPEDPGDPSLRQALSQFSLYTHVLITSQTTIKILVDYLPLFGYSLQEWGKKTTVVVGKSSARQLVECGLKQFVVAKEETAEGMVAQLEELDRSPDHFFFWPHSKLSRPVIRDFLLRHQLSYAECLLYDTKPLIPTPLPCLEKFDEIVFTSPSTVDAFVTIFGSFLPHHTLTPLGPVTAHYLELKTHLTQKGQNEGARDFEKSINSKSAAIFY